MRKLSNVEMIVIGLLMIVALYVLVLNSRDGYRKDRTLLDNAWSKSQLPSYTINWAYDVELPQGGSVREEVGERENYSGHYDCERVCLNEIGVGNREDCVQRCMALNVISRNGGGNVCARDEDCGGDNICVGPGAYTSDNYGQCMNANEPGILPAKIKKEGFAHSYTCDPGYFYNDVSNRCEARFQAASVAMHPGPIMPEVTIPGSTLLGYGVGRVDPVDIPTEYGTILQ